jgi:hypothetical protein
LAQLAKEMAENPGNMLQKVVEMAVDLSVADTAGISLFTITPALSLGRNLTSYESCWLALGSMTRAT